MMRKTVLNLYILVLVKVLLVLCMVFAASPLLAQQEPLSSEDSESQEPLSSEDSPVVSDTYPVSDTSISLINPLSGINSIEGLVQTLLNVIIVLAAPIIVFFIMLAGFKYVIARGDPNKLEEAKRALVYAIIGGVIVVGAVAIFEIIAGTIDAFRDNP